MKTKDVVMDNILNFVEKFEKKLKRRSDEDLISQFRTMNPQFSASVLIHATIGNELVRRGYKVSYYPNRVSRKGARR